MELEKRNESIKEALRHEFDFAPKDRAIEIYHTAKAMGYTEQAEEMASDIIIEFNINVTK
tara:strand:- start:140 stop:319 length:180 start_codon:yes stop_codon:yes gene_type:complete